MDGHRYDLAAGGPKRLSGLLVLPTSHVDRIALFEPGLATGIDASEGDARPQFANGDPRRTHQRVPRGGDRHVDLVPRRQAQRGRRPRDGLRGRRPFDHHRIRRRGRQHDRIRRRSVGAWAAQGHRPRAEGHRSHHPELGGAEDGVAVAAETQRKGAHPQAAQVELHTRVGVEAVVLGHDVYEPPASHRQVDRGPHEEASRRARAVEVQLSAGREHSAAPPCRERHVVAGIGLQAGEPGGRDHVGGQRAAELGATGPVEDPRIGVAEPVRLEVVVVAVAEGGRRHMPQPHSGIEVPHRRRQHRDPAERAHHPAAFRHIAEVLKGRAQLDAVEEPDRDRAVRQPLLEGFSRRKALAVAIHDEGVRDRNPEPRVGAGHHKVWEYRRHGDIQQPGAVPQGRGDAGGLGAARSDVQCERENADNARKAEPTERARHPSSVESSRLKPRQIRQTQNRIRIQAAA